jgi:hypothetical protein
MAHELAPSRRRLPGMAPRGWLIAVGAVVALSAAVVVSRIVFLGNSSRGETSGQTRTLPRIRQLPAATPTILTSSMPAPISGGLSENVVITDRQFLADDQLFDRGGRGIAVVVDNRNYQPVDIVVEGTLYDGDTVIQKIPGGPYSMDGRQTLLIPLKTDARLRPTHFGIRIVRVTPTNPASPSP